MAETTRPNPDQQPAPRRQGEGTSERQTVTVEGRELAVEPPTPTQAEADAIKAGTAQEPLSEAPANETEAQRKEREAKEQQQRRERDQRPDPARSGYTTR